MSNAMMFIVPGEPVGKGRPRGRRMGKGIMFYTPDKTVDYENKIRACAIEACGDILRPLWVGAVKIEVLAYMGIPKNTSKKHRLMMERGQLLPLKKPDCDNILKVVLDALNGVAFRDDKQVVAANCEKRYCDEGKFPSIFVGITYVEGCHG